MNIRHLKTAYGELLDLEDRVVSDFFDDRGADGNIRNSTLEVHRYAPIPEELQIVQRFSSLAPTSSARPQKRPLELPSQSYPSKTSRNIYRPLPSVEDWGAETGIPFGTATKRQRTHESGLNRAFDAHQKSIVREEQGGGPCHSFQDVGTQESIHQVVDSQKSPGKKSTSCLSCRSIVILTNNAGLNPYGTPTSLHFSGLQESVPSNEIDISAIPDSPLGREITARGGNFGRAMQFDRVNTKSESPELISSVLELPNQIDASDGQPIESQNSLEPSDMIYINNSTPPIVDENLKSHSLGLRQTQEKAADVNRTPTRGPSTETPAHAQNVQSHSNVLRGSDPIFDPIESDTESFNEKQQMQSAKRLRSSKTPTTSSKSLDASDKAGADRRDGQFLVPSLPQSHTNGARKSLCAGQRESVPVPGRISRDADITVQSDPKRHSEPDTESCEDAQSKPCENDHQTTGRETPRRTTTCDDHADAVQNLSQATTTWSQESNSSGNGTAESNVPQRDNRVSSQLQNRDEKKHLVHDVVGEANNSETLRFTDGAKRLAEETEVQHEKMRISEAKAEEKRLAHEAMENNIVAKKEAADRKTKEKTLADKKSAKEGKARAQESAQVRKANAKEVEFADAKQMGETGVNEARLLEENTTSERLARERQMREKLLAEEANRLNLATEGAKQIEAERKEKEKARREELAAKRNANEAKAVEQAREAESKKSDKKAQRAQENAQKLAGVESKAAKDQVHQDWTTQATAGRSREQAQKRLADQEVQKVKDSSEVPHSRDSTDLSTTAGPKRSMTPLVPGSSVIKSSPYLSSSESSPLSNRSSGNMDAPLRSALRQTPSALRRSVSSVSFDLPPQAKPNGHIPSTPKPRSIQEINKNLTTKSSSVTDLSENPLKIESKTPSKMPVKTLPKKTPDGRITKPPAKNGKVQTKLNVTREPKKLKGPAVNPPIDSVRAPKQAPKKAPKQAPKQEIILSSGDESSTSEEPVWQSGNAKAGPSSRKPIFPSATSQKKKISEVKSSSASIDPALGEKKLEKDNKATPATVPRSTPKVNMTSLQKSISRSPAMALSETVSLSSDSDSSSDPSTPTESRSDSEEEEEESQTPSSKTPTGAKNGWLAPVTRNGISKAVNVGVKRPERDLESKSFSQTSSQASSSRPHSTISMHGDRKHVAQTADKQLQLESRQSIPDSRTNQTFSITKNGVNDKVINQGLNHAGRLPNGIRPPYYKYPHLSELQKLPQEVTPEEQKVDTASSPSLGASLVEKSGFNESSSESEDSSSDSDEDDDVDEAPSQTSSKKKPGLSSGVRSLVKRRLNRLPSSVQTTDLLQLQMLFDPTSFLPSHRTHFPLEVEDIFQCLQYLVLSFRKRYPPTCLFRKEDVGKSTLFGN